MSLRFTSKRISNLRIRDNKVEERQSIICALETLYVQAESSPDIFIPQDQHQSLGVHLKPLPINKEDSQAQIPVQYQFFKPMPLSTLKIKHSKCLATKDIERSKNIELNMMEGGGPVLKEFGLSAPLWTQTQYLCTRLHWEVEEAPRKGTKENAQPLRKITGWRCLRYVSCTNISSAS
jgi:hypothetical protein